MAKCALCDVKPQSGNNVSHSNRHTKRKFLPNIQRATLVIGGKRMRINVCTRCLRTQQRVRLQV